MVARNPLIRSAARAPPVPAPPGGGDPVGGGRGAPGGPKMRSRGGPRKSAFSRPIFGSKMQKSGNPGFSGFWGFFAPPGGPRKPPKNPLFWGFLGHFWLKKGGFLAPKPGRRGLLGAGSGPPGSTGPAPPDFCPIFAIFRQNFGPENPRFLGTPQNPKIAEKCNFPVL